MHLELPENATPHQAVLWLKRLIRDFGLGFHPDTSPADYVLPNGSPLLSAPECKTLKRSVTNIFRILGDDMPYDVCADEASAIIAESMHMKPPLEFHDPEFQRALLRGGTRDELITWLCWNDPNGVYTDADSIAEGRSPLALKSAREITADQIQRDFSHA